VRAQPKRNSHVSPISKEKTLIRLSLFRTGPRFRIYPLRALERVCRSPVSCPLSWRRNPEIFAEASQPRHHSAGMTGSVQKRGCKNHRQRETPRLEMDMEHYLAVTMRRVPDQDLGF